MPQAIKQEPAPDTADNIPETNQISSLCKTEDVQDTAIASTSNNAAPDPDVVFTQIQQCVEESSGPDMLKLKVIPKLRRTRNVPIRKAKTKKVSMRKTQKK